MAPDRAARGSSLPGEDDAEKRAGFQEEALPHLDAVYRFGLRLSASPAGAEDLVQETFLRAYRFWDQYTLGTNCKSWLFTICRNVFLRQQNRSQRHDEILKEQLPGEKESLTRENPVFAATREVDPEGEFFRSLVDDEVLEAIDRLPEEYRSVVVLSDLEGMAYKEIAELMEIPVGTVKSRLYRGRQQLQEWLYEYAVTTGYLSPQTEPE